jgi:hypothetical protein
MSNFIEQTTGYPNNSEFNQSVVATQLDQYGDYLTVATESNYSDIINCIERASYEHKKAIIKAGDYNMTTSDSLAHIIAADNIVIEGSGKNTRLYDTSLTETLADFENKALMRFKGRENIEISRIYFEGNQLYPNSTTNQYESGNGIFFDNDGATRSTNVEVHSCYFRDGHTGLYTFPVDYANFHDLHFKNLEHPIVIGDSTNVNLSNITADIEDVGDRAGGSQRGLLVYHSQKVQICNIALNNETGTNVFIRAADAVSRDTQDITMVNVTADSTTRDVATYGIHIQSGDTTGIYNVVVANCIIRINITAALRFTATTAGTVKHIYFVNCQLISDEGYSFGSAADTLDTYEDIKFVNCYFSGKQGALFYKIKDLTLDDCTFESDGTSVNSCDVRFITNLKMSNCTSSNPNGYDFNFSDITGDSLITGCSAVNSSIATTNVSTADFICNKGFGTLNQTVNNVIWDSHSTTLEDDANESIDVQSTPGWGMAQIGDNEAYALFSFPAGSGAVVLISNSANVDNADTDGKLSIFKTGNNLILKNRLGGSKTIRYQINRSY